MNRNEQRLSAICTWLETEGSQLCVLARSGCCPQRGPLELITISKQAESLGGVTVHGTCRVQGPQPSQDLLSSAALRFLFLSLAPSPLASPRTSSVPRETHRDELSLLHPLGPLSWVVTALPPTDILLDSGGSTPALLPCALPPLWFTFSLADITAHSHGCSSCPALQGQGKPASKEAELPSKHLPYVRGNKCTHVPLGVASQTRPSVCLLHCQPLHTPVSLH